jgi:hypothetical protein
MSYIVSVGQTLGLDFSELRLQTSLLHTDVEKLGIDNGASLVKGLPVNALRPAWLRKGSERDKFQSPMLWCGCSGSIVGSAIERSLK